MPALGSSGPRRLTAGLATATAAIMLASSAQALSPAPAAPGPRTLFETPGEQLLPATWFGTLDGLDTAVGQDGTMAVIYKDDPEDDADWAAMVRVRPVGGSWSTPVQVSPPGVDVYHDVSIDVAPDGSVVAAWGEDPAGDVEDPVVIRTVSAAGALGPRLQAAPKALTDGPVVRMNSGGDLVVAWLEVRPAGSRLRTAWKASGAAGFAAPLFVSASDRNVYPDFELHLSDTRRSWVAYRDRLETGPYDARWGTYRPMVDDSPTSWHTARLIDGTALNVGLSGNPAGHVLFTANTSEGVHTRSWAVGGEVIDPTPPTPPELTGDVVLPAYARQSHVSTTGQEYLLLTRPTVTGLAVRTIDTSWATTEVTGANGPTRLLVGENSTAVITTSSTDDQSYLDVHRAPLGGAFVLDQQIGPAGGTYRLEDGEAADGDGFVVYSDSGGNPRPMYWLTETDTEPPAPQEVTLDALSEWTLRPATDVTWSTAADEVELQRRVGGSTVDAEAPWSLEALPAHSPHRAALAAGATHCFRARDTTPAAPGAWPWSNYACTTAPLDDRSLSGRARWAKVRDQRLYRGTGLKTTRRNRSLSVMLRGSYEIVLVATKCPKCGKVQLRWRGKSPKTINLRSRKVRRQVVIRTPGNYGQMPGGPPRDGKFSIRVLTRGKLVLIDGVGSIRDRTYVRPSA